MPGNRVMRTAGQLGCRAQRSGFDALMPKTLATATVDRLLHHAHVCQTTGESIRLTQALAGKGVTAMT